MTKPASTIKNIRKQHSPEFRQEALKLAERIGIAAAARELSLYESQLYSSNSSHPLTAKMNSPLKMPVSNASWLNGTRN